MKYSGVVLRCLNSRFKMFRLSSSSTFGLWLSLLRRNTKTTFWTIVSSDNRSSLNGLQLLRCARSREESPMFPSRIQTAAVRLQRRRSPHLEQSAKLILLFCCCYYYFEKSANYFSGTVCCISDLLHNAAAVKALLSTTRYTRFSTGSWWAAGARLPPVSLVTACRINRGGA